LRWPQCRVRGSRRPQRGTDLQQDALWSHRAPPPGAGVIVRLRKCEMELTPGVSATAPLA
jgi:hypothetical protein